MKELRLSRNLSQKEFCKLFSISQSTYSGYETGISNPSIKFLIRLSKFYGVSVDYILGLSDCKETRYLTHDAKMTNKDINEAVNFIDALEGGFDKLSTDIAEYLNIYENKDEDN